MDPSLFYGSQVKSNRILCTPSDFAKSNLIYLQEAGELQAQKPHTSNRENLASYLCFIVLEGSGTLEYEGKVHELAAGDCAFLDCRKGYAHRCSKDLWHLRWVHFYGANMGGIYGKYVERGGKACFHPVYREKYVDLLEQLHGLAAESSCVRDMQIYGKLASLLALLMEESRTPCREIHGADKKRDLREVKEYLEEHYQEKVNLDDLAERFFVNKFYLTRIFKEQFGVPVTSYLLQVRVTHAKQLLRFSDLSVEEVAYRCGMNDANYFSRMFRKIEGTSPGEFRKMW